MRMTTTTSPPVTPRTRGWLAKLGPGLVTGASDDDPSGIATYSQAGAQFGYTLGWTLLLSFPLMVAIQEACARLGRISGKGLATNIAENFPRPVAYVIALLLLAANVINLGADLGAMAAAMQLLVGGPHEPYVVGFGLVSTGLMIFVSYERYSAYLKWLCLSLFAYVATVFAVQVPWGEVARQLVWPGLQADTDYVTAAVAIFGTTISPYLFFWQASQEAERQAESPRMKPLTEAPRQAPAEFRRIRIDTWLGMGLSNLIGLFIVITTAATLHASGKLDIQTSADAASALRPVAGDFAFAIFAAGIVGTGMLGVPVLAGAAAFGVCGTLGRPAGLACRPVEAKTFYGTIFWAMVVGVGLNTVAIDPIRALFWSAVVNGLVAVPIMTLIMIMSGRPAIVREFQLPRPLSLLGWATTVFMAAIAAVMVWSWLA
ncbi:Nramp family divalent metal transporter [Inquilinus sp.]|uniref:Nramp family divalent metal transporter n=1 Tax=Inquilinus sp. TaxID=1932117 RepID=UPI0031DEF3D8